MAGHGHPMAGRLRPELLALFRRRLQPAALPFLADLRSTFQALDALHQLLSFLASALTLPSRLMNPGFVSDPE